MVENILITPYNNVGTQDYVNKGAFMTIPKINNTDSTPIKFSVNQNGAIEIESLKNTSIYEIAQKYDNSGCDNELLEGAELTAFLKEVTQDKVMSKALSINEDSSKYTYYEQKDSNGKLLKRCIALKGNNDMMSFDFKDGKPKFCTTYMADGEKDIINLDNGRSTNYPADGSRQKHFILNEENRQALKRIGLGKPTHFNFGIDEFMYRLSHWDWGEW